MSNVYIFLTRYFLLYMEATCLVLHTAALHIVESVHGWLSKSCLCPLQVA